MSSSDSDSEEARLREAVDPEFDAKKKKKTGSSDDSDKKKDRSLRRDKVKNSVEPVSGSGLSVTKGFQEHVAKKLSESIEK